MQRYGITVPFDGPLHAQRAQYEEVESLGYTDLWSAEANGVDGLTPLALASTWTPSMRLGTAILPAFTRGPALMAQSVAGLASAAPGRFVAGIGSSSNVIVENWNGIEFTEPYKQTRDLVRFLKSSLTGEKVTEEYDTFSIKGFRLMEKLEVQPPILIAALREGMLKMAGRESDGAIINWLSAENVATVSSVVHEAAGGEDREIVARIFMIPSEDREMVLSMGKYAMAAYLNVPVYRLFHEWMGRSDVLGEHWDQWAAGDRKGSLEKIPDSVVDELIVSGSAAECKAHVERYIANGVTTPAISIMPMPGVDVPQAIRDLAPNS